MTQAELQRMAEERIKDANMAEKWTVTSRYEAKTEIEAKDIFAAIVDIPYGVLVWVRNYW